MENIIYFIQTLGDTLKSILGTIEPFKWVIVVGFGLWYFRRIVTYLFFSMDEFNFFGTHGKLKNVRDLIKEKAYDLSQSEKNKKEITETLERLENQIREKDAVGSKVVSKFESFVTIMSDFIGKNGELIQSSGNNDLMKAYSKIGEQLQSDVARITKD